MKILQLNSGLMINGALTYCRVLTEELYRMGHDVSVACRPGSWICDAFTEPIQVYEDEMSRTPGELRRFAGWIRSQRFDLIHTHMSRAHSLGVLMKLMTGTPVVATAHSCSIQLHWRLNDFVLANSNATMEYQAKVNRVSRSKMKTVHCFSGLDQYESVEKRDLIRVQRQLRLKGDEFLIGVVGEVVERKGHVYLFEALSQIVNEVPNAKIVLIGRFHRKEAYVRRLRGILLKNGLLRRVKWLGYRYNIPDFMTNFDITVVPSLSEPLGLVALESLAAGTPVVASDVGGLSEIVRHNENGFLVPARDSKSIANAVVRLAGDEALRVGLGGNGKRMVHKRFCPTKLAGEVADVYQQLVGKRLKASA